MNACYKGHLNITRYLISEAYCDPSCKDKYGNTPLHDACLNGRAQIVEYLLSTGKVDPCTG